MPTFQAVIDARGRAKQREWEVRQEQAREAKRQEQLQEEARISALKIPFIKAVERLRKSIDANIRRDADNTNAYRVVRQVNLYPVLEELISESERIVDSLYWSEHELECKKRTDALEKIIIWADNSINGQVNVDDETIDIITKEIDSHSFTDNKIIRVIEGIAFIALGIVLTVALLGVAALPFVLCTLSVTTALIAAGFALLSMFTAANVLVGFSFMGCVAIDSEKSNVGREVRQLSRFFTPIEDIDATATETSQYTASGSF